MLSLSHPWHPSSHPSCLEHLGTHGPGSAVPHLWKGPQQAREVWDIAASRTGENLWESMKIYQNLWKMNDRWWTYACLASVWHVSVLIHLCGNLEGLERRRTSFDWIAQCPIYIFWGITFPLYVSQARHLLRVFLNGRFGRCFQAQDQRCRASHLGPGILERTRVGPLGHCMTSESECSHCARHQDRSRQLLRVGLRPNSLVEGRCEALALISMNVT